jgi:hypothetical protein
MTQNTAWLRFEQGAEADLERFLAEAPADRPIRIVLEGGAWGPRACELIAFARPGLDLRVLFLRGAPLGDSALGTLAGSPALASVRSLGVERCGMTDLGLRWLAQSPHVSGLRELYLCNREGIETGPLNEIGEAGALALAASPNLGALETLDLWNTGVGDAGLEAIVASTHLPRLSKLTAWKTRLTREGLARVKAAAAEAWERRKAAAEGAPYCWINSDYDERVITY